MQNRVRSPKVNNTANFCVLRDHAVLSCYERSIPFRMPSGDAKSQHSDYGSFCNTPSDPFAHGRSATSTSGVTRAKTASVDGVATGDSAANLAGPGADESDKIEKVDEDQSVMANVSSQHWGSTSTLSCFTTCFRFLPGIAPAPAASQRYSRQQQLGRRGRHGQQLRLHEEKVAPSQTRFRSH